jgi:hypothetical protein
MYAQIGDIILSGHYGFTAWSDEKGSNIIEHPLIESKPRLQKIGDELDKFNFSVNLNRGFVDIEAETARWNKLVSDSTVVPVTLGTGEFLGNFILTKIKKVVDQTDASGGIVQCTLELNAVEFISDIQENKGTAVLSNNPASVKSVAVQKSLAGQITGNVTDCSNLTEEMNTNLTLAEKSPKQKDKKLKDTLNKIKLIDAKLKATYILTSNVFNLINEAQNMRQRIKTTQTLLQTLKDAATFKDVAGARLAMTAFQGSVRGLTALSSVFTKTYALRQTA